MREAFDRVEMSIDTYYRRKQDLPGDIAEIERQAKESARKARLEALEEFSTGHLEASMEIQRRATEGLHASIEILGRIARGEHRVVETEDGKSKIILTRPRDQIAAVRALQKIARHGIIPKGSLVLQQNDKPSPPPPLPFPGLDFTRVEATATDGTTIVMERSDESVSVQTGATADCSF